MIDPDAVTQFNASREWKEEFLLFCACAAGKGAYQQAKKLDELLRNLNDTFDFPDEVIQPFALVQNAYQFGYLESQLKAVKMGQYARLTEALGRLSKLDVDTCTIEDLESIPGIGPKTARFFVVHTRPDQRYAILDTHILGYLRDEGFQVPKATPSGRVYKNIENLVLAIVENSGMTYADWDLSVWKSRSRKQ